MWRIMLVACVGLLGCGDDGPTGPSVSIYRQDSMNANLSMGAHYEIDCVTCPVPAPPSCGVNCDAGEYRANVSCSWAAGHETQRKGLGTFDFGDFEQLRISWELDGDSLLESVRVYCESAALASYDLTEFAGRNDVLVSLEFRFVWWGGSATAEPGHALQVCPTPEAAVTVSQIEITGHRSD